MDYMNIISAVLCLGILGGLLGLALAFAAKAFAVEVDERQEKIVEILPGANCGGCGYAGCSAYAAAVTEGEAPANACAPGGSAAAAKIAGIMGIEDAGEAPRSVALVKCSGGNKATKKFAYAGLTDCLSAVGLRGGATECPSGCIGLGSCVAACPFGVITIEDGVARIDHERCSGCMACAASCPKSIIVKVPFEADITVACSSAEKGGILRSYCQIGCIGCKICEKNCPNEAIKVTGNLAEIDYEKCDSCGICAQKCPRKLIHDAGLNKEHDVVVNL